MTSSEELDDRRRRLDVMSETRCSRSYRYRGAVPWVPRYTMTASFIVMI